jgi:hypothetical protein
VGNAFIVFGGDTKMDEGDLLDDTLYLLNTCKLTRNHALGTITDSLISKPQNNGQERYPPDLDPLVVTDTL